MFGKWSLFGSRKAGDAKPPVVVPADDQTVIHYAEPATVIMQPVPAAPGVAARPPVNVFEAKTRIIGAPGDTTVVISTDGAPARAPADPLPGIDIGLAAGSVLDGRYEVLKVIGRGGFSYVYLCQHVRNGRLYAVKEAYGGNCRRLDTTVVADVGNTYFAEARAALLREVSAISRVNHPGVVRLENIFEQNGTTYFAMDYVEGEPLSALLARRGAISEATFRALSGAILEAVGQLHENDVLHGDIKPANIIVRPNKSIVLIDFGSTERLSDVNSTTLVVSEGYSAVERYSSEGRLGPWSDVYSCAATLASALTGQPPPPVTTMLTEPDNLHRYLAAGPGDTQHRQRWLAGLTGGMITSIERRTQSISLLQEAMGLAPSKGVGSSEPRESDGHAVFVSYSHHDADLVEAHVRALQLRGVGVWIDRQRIKPGSAAWGGDIMRGMRGSQVVLVFSSRHSMQSENVTREIYLADKLRKPIVVALLDGEPFGDDVSIFLTPSQHVRAADSDPVAIARDIIQLLDRLQTSAAASASLPA
jgi:serine/threonine protein kinase